MTQNITLEEYQKFCDSIAKKSDDKEKEIMGWGLGVAGEAGDVASCIKKTYGHKNDQINGIKENLGDTLWYIAEICNFYGWKLEDVIQENVDKLKKRYSDGHFTYESAQRDGTKIDWNESR
jgi:NTP pyrophosphatase (non-canonical NTP hydrolase)